MSAIEIANKVETLQEWEALANEAAAMVESIKDEIKAVMLERDTEELTAGRFIVRWTQTISNRLDSGSLKRDHPEIYTAYCKPQTSRRWKVSQ